MRSFVKNLWDVLTDVLILATAIAICLTGLWIYMALVTNPGISAWYAVLMGMGLAFLLLFTFSVIYAVDLTIRDRLERRRRK